MSTNHEDQGVHPFTLQWWQHLPDVYQRADRSQGYRLTEAWHGMNRDPRFITGYDGWHRANLSTKAWESALGLFRSFRATPNVPVTIRTWHNPTVVDDSPQATSELGQGQIGVMVLGDAGAFVSVRHIVRDHTNTVIADTTATYTDPGRQSHVTVVTPDRFGVLHVTVQVVLSLPDGLNLVEAIHVGTQDSTFEDLPGVGYFTEASAYPLLRYMDGIGHQAGFLSDMVNDMHEGRYTDPVTAPDSALDFLAAVLSVPETYSRRLTPGQLRQHLVDLVEGDYPTPGSQDHIAITAQQWLTGSRTVSVVPAHTLPGYTGPDPLHTLVVTARADEVPNNDLVAFAQFLNDAGVIPAGHRVIAREASQTWDQWTAAAGATWSATEQKIKTWNDNDSVGVVL